MDTQKFYDDIYEPVDKENTPLPEFPHLASDEARAQVFGHFDFVRSSTTSDPDAIIIIGPWIKSNIVQVEIPQLAKIPGIRYGNKLEGAGPKNGIVLCHHLVANQLKRFWQDIEDAELLSHVLTWHGLWCPRTIRGYPSLLSAHAWGSAFDINGYQNPLGHEPAKWGTRGSVRDLVWYAHLHGFFWGGHFKRTDGMHFECAKIIVPTNLSLDNQST